ncbi:MAG: UDP-3-O-(3-hydroxymyristoyl)glucosamine N-acyltransferase [Candidatus Hydrogenedentes bacterium]|nr:UDP-3-O-(3-hydroxymyristoyl)glucosamine N-acyltransferase [Candidatus Hydrogenedentota bacterium]
MKMTVGEIAALVGGTVVGDPQTPVAGVSGIREARRGDLTFLADPRYQPFLATTKASAVFVPLTVHEAVAALIQVAEPRTALFTLLKKIQAEQAWRPNGIHPTAIIGQDVTLGNDVVIDAYACIGEGSTIGDGATIHAQVYIGRQCHVGAQTVLCPQVTIRDYVSVGARCILHPGVVLGSDGFGYAELGGVHVKIPQVGTVVLGDDIEVGANSCIDRATLGATVVGDGTKIDNLVQIGHNVQLGRNCILCGNVGIAGSALIHDNVVFGGAASVIGHVEIGAGARMAALSGATKDIKPGQTVSGFPATEVGRFRRKEVALRQLPDALSRIKILEQRLAQLEGNLHGTPKDDS